MTQKDVVAVLSECLPDLRTRIISYRNTREKLTESDTIRVLVLPIIEALGWNLQDLEEVRSEYRHAAAHNPVDYALFLQGIPILFVEAKAFGVNLDDPKPLLQTLNYANAAGVDWCVLTNGAEWKIYKVHAQVPADEKLFLTAQLDGPDAEIRLLAATLSLLSRDRMHARWIDTLWIKWRVDRQVESILNGIENDDAFVRFVTKRATGLTKTDVGASLRRSGLRTSYPENEAFMAQLEQRNPPLPPGKPVTHADIDAAPADGETSAKKKRLMRTKEMVEKGLLPVGTKLTIKGHSDSEAIVVDGRTVEFRGEQMTFNVWGCRVTGWPTIQIYIYAMMPDGRLLDELRDD